MSDKELQIGDWVEWPITLNSKKTHACSRLIWISYDVGYVADKSSHLGTHAVMLKDLRFICHHPYKWMVDRVRLRFNKSISRSKQEEIAAALKEALNEVAEKHEG